MAVQNMLISSHFKSLSCLNNSSVWSYFLLNVIVLIWKQQKRDDTDKEHLNNYLDDDGEDIKTLKSNNNIINDNVINMYKQKEINMISKAYQDEVYEYEDTDDQIEIKYKGAKNITRFNPGQCVISPVFPMSGPAGCREACINEKESYRTALLFDGPWNVSNMFLNNYKYATNIIKNNLKYKYKSLDLDRNVV